MVAFMCVAMSINWNALDIAGSRNIKNALDTPLFVADGQAIGEKRGISVACV